MCRGTPLWCALLSCGLWVFALITVNNSNNKKPSGLKRGVVSRADSHSCRTSSSRLGTWTSLSQSSVAHRATALPGCLPALGMAAARVPPGAMLDVKAACLFPHVTCQLFAPSAANGGLRASGGLSEASSSGNLCSSPSC